MSRRPSRAVAVERLDDLELARVAKARLDSGEPPVRVSLDELIAEAERGMSVGERSEAYEAAKRR